MTLLLADLLTMNIPKKYQDEVAKLRRGLYIVWDDKAGWAQPYGRFVVRFKDPRTNLDRKAVVVQDKDGNRTDLNMGVLRMIKGSVRWDLVDKFPDPEKIYDELDREQRVAKAEVELERRGVITDFIKANKSFVKDAMRDLKQRIVS